MRESRAMNWLELEQQFVAEGWGNGALHPHVVHDPINYWAGGHIESDFYVGFDFHRTDWEALFWKALNAAREEEYVQGEDIEEYHERNRRRFTNSLSMYPLLARMFDMYEDAVYESSEVGPLRDECLKARRSTNHEDAIRAVDKVIFACNKATDCGLGLLFISD
jgi:hypothetical protein